MGMEWTKEMPTVSGVYYYCGPPEADVVQMLDVVKFPDGLMMFYSFGSEIPEFPENLEGGQWFGPLELPPPPPE